VQTVQPFRTSEGREIYALPVEAFTGFIVNLYLVTDGSSTILVDCGSGMEESRRQLLERFEELRRDHGVALRLEDVDTILITHGHIDHFGGLRWVKAATGAPAGVHVLDRRVLSNYEERVIVASKAVEAFLRSSGIDGELQAKLMEVYLWAKGRYRSTEVDFLLKEGNPAPGGFEVIHVPGHCPGQVCLRVDDILLTADHVLSRITPGQAPEAITQYTGLGHYFDSLEKIAAVPGIRLGLGGHEAPIADVAGRARAIRKHHDRRLERVLEICTEPRTLADVSLRLFGARKSYHVLLALLETGAHVEYLYQRGELSVSNFEEIENVPGPVLRYRCN
jgi:glyoxylase-like metal-dependent hydrolase (beta-lactamase superfamily II)